MKPSLYLETSVISYLAARPSRNIVTAARQKLTIEWWKHRRKGFDVFISPLVLEEVELGDPDAAVARLAILSSIAVIAPSLEADDLASALLKGVPLPRTAVADAVHIAVASTSGANYLLTWNFKHIANPILREQITSICRMNGYDPPVICTPEDLLEGTST